MTTSQSDDELAKQLRNALAKPDDAILTDFFDRLDARILDLTVSQSASLSEEQVKFVEELQDIYHSSVNPSSLSQLEIFVEVLFHSRHIMPCSSLISTWFDLVLRPALREPRLPTPVVGHAKDLIIRALLETDVECEKVRELRKRLVHLYLLDVYNESSGSDLLQLAYLGEREREKLNWWKDTLEDTLVRFGLLRPNVRYTSPFEYTFMMSGRNSWRP